MLGRRRLASTIFIVAIVAIAYYLFERPRPPGDLARNQPTPPLDSREPLGIGTTKTRPVENIAAESNHPFALGHDPSAHAPRPLSDCIDWREYARSSEAHAIDKWFATWGAPPMFDQSLAARPYAAYPESDLEALANDDRHALHELGRDKVWRALTGDLRMPDYATLWDAGDEEHPFTEVVLQQLLEGGRTDLYRAAVRGNLYALTELSLSYSLELAATRAAIGDDRQRDLRLQAAIYLRIVPKLIDDFPFSSVITRIDEDLKETVELSRETIIEQFREDRTAAGLDPDVGLVAPAAAHRFQDVCLEGFE